MVSLGTHQDDQARTGEPTVVGPGYRDAKGGAAGRGVGGARARSAEEKPPASFREEAPPTTCPDQGQARTTSRGESLAPSRETGATGGQTRRRAGTPAREAGAASSQRSRAAGPSVSKSSDPAGTHKRSPKARGEAGGTSASAGMLCRTLSAACL